MDKCTRRHIDGAMGGISELVERILVVRSRESVHAHALLNNVNGFKTK